MIDELIQTLEIYGMPSQSLWRALELAKLKELRKVIGFTSPILEIGCGEGGFSALIFESIDDGIDINPRSIERCKRKPHVYKRLHCMDARFMKFPQNSYQTIFANCVIEHIPDLDKVLLDSYRVLMPGGKFVATIPLKEMNNYLLLQRDWYVEMRRKQLQHVNLLTEDKWKEIFQKSGFSEVKTFPYLSEKDCYRWDILDFPICIGHGRYTVGAVLRLMDRTVPVPVRKMIYQAVAHWLSARIVKHHDYISCAIVLIAQK
jgi:ubiquinone/menaquinone biosynthesis C-methylase UbiE